MDPDDSALLDGYVRDGAGGAFRELVQRHLGVVFQAALRQVGGDSHRAEEVAQEVFTLLARKAPSLTEHPMLIGWLFSTTRRVAARVMRTERRRQRREQIAWEMAETAAAEDTVDWRRLQPVLDAAMDDLAPAERDALLLRFFQEHPFVEIGRRTNVSEDAARMRVARALEKLRLRLMRHGVTSTTAALALVLTSHVGAAPAPAGLTAHVTAVALGNAAAGGTIFAMAAKVLLMTKTHMVAAGAAFVLLTGAVVWQSGENATLDRQLEHERQRSETLRASISHFERDHAVAVTPGAPPPSAVAASTSEQEKKRQWMLTSRRVYDRQYAALYRRIRLPPAELDQFKDLLAEREWDRMVALNFGRKNGLTDMTIREARQIQQVAGIEANERIRAFLGEANYAYFERYDQSASLRNLFSNFTDELKLLGAPLSDDQMDRFLELAHASMQEGLDTSREGGGPLISDSMFASASTFLSPIQAERLRAAQEWFYARWRMSAINRAAAEQGKLKLTTQSARHYPGSGVAKE